MEWQQLQYFQTVARLEHMTKAAAELYVSQPALSRSIARLEKEIGVPLFERQGRSVKLNRYGKMFLQQVNTATESIEKGKQEIRDNVNPTSGNIKLSFLPTLGAYLVPSLLQAYREQYPQVTFQLYQNPSSKLIKQLLEGEADLSLSPLPKNDQDVVWMELLSDELFVIVPKHHSLAGRKEISLNEIENEPFIGFKKGFGIRDLTDSLCQAAGFVPRLTFEGEDAGTVAGLVSAGLGVGLIPMTGGADVKNLSVLKVSDRACRRPIGLAWVEGRYMSPAAKNFRDFILDHTLNVKGN